jgi:hypothetical protein
MIVIDTPTTASQIHQLGVLALISGFRNSMLAAGRAIPYTNTRCESSMVISAAECQRWG